MDTLAITSITNFILAGEMFFLAGLTIQSPKTRFSAAWFWGGAMFALATSALLGGIDHGFVEPAGLSRYALQRSNWIVVGAATFGMLLATAQQFFPGAWLRPTVVVGLVQFTTYATAVLLIGDFRLVILNYAPVMLLLLGLSLRGIGNGVGSWHMVVGIVLLLAASMVQALGIDVLTPLDRSGLYHVISMAGMVFLYSGGRRLDGRGRDKDVPVRPEPPANVPPRRSTSRATRPGRVGAR